MTCATALANNVKMQAPAAQAAAPQMAAPQATNSLISQMAPKAAITAPGVGGNLKVTA